MSASIEQDGLGEEQETETCFGKQLALGLPAFVILAEIVYVPDAE
jgi:hypothetical protein